MEENEEDGQDQIKYLDAGMFHLHTLAFILNYWFCSRIYIHILVCCSKEVYPTTTTGIRAVRARYMPLLWPVPQSGAAVEHNDVILMNLMTSHFFNPTPQPISSLSIPNQQVIFQRIQWVFSNILRAISVPNGAVGTKLENELKISR